MKKRSIYLLISFTSYGQDVALIQLGEIPFEQLFATWFVSYHQTITLSSLLGFPLSKSVMIYTRLGWERGSLTLSSATRDHALHETLNGFFTALGMNFVVTPLISIHIEWNHTTFGDGHSHHVYYNVGRYGFEQGFDFNFGVDV